MKIYKKRWWHKIRPLFVKGICKNCVFSYPELDDKIKDVAPLVCSKNHDEKGNPYSLKKNDYCCGFKNKNAK